MSDVDDWDADDFEPALPVRPAVPFDDKWEGEDEEDDKLKDNWEDEDEEEEKPAQPKTGAESQAYQRPKKKPLAERLAEKQAQKEKEKEEKERKEKEEKREVTAEERLAEKIKLQKIQENDSLNLARGLFGEQEKSSIDKMFPTSEEDFKEFSEALKNKIGLFEESPHYQTFAAKLINDLVVGLGVEDVKKLGVQINSLYHEKERQRKEAEKKKKKKSKATIKVDRADDFDLISDATGGAAAYDDDDDFI